MTPNSKIPSFSPLQIAQLNQSMMRKTWIFWLGLNNEYPKFKISKQEEGKDVCQLVVQRIWAAGHPPLARFKTFVGSVETKRSSVEELP
ncbi:hypothetical protein SLE2022_096780 [Rubroshorea leprosula]